MDMIGSVRKPVEPISPIQNSRDGDTFEQTIPSGHEYKPSPKPIGPDIYSNQPEKVAEVKKATDIQVGGDHYKRFKIQPVEFCILNGIGFGEGNVIKYVCRHQFKNGIEDLKKARHYIDLLIQLEYGDENQRLQAQQEVRHLYQEDDK
jgi:hypothetical protein